jgi:hypothetical protein
MRGEKGERALDKVGQQPHIVLHHGDELSSRQHEAGIYGVALPEPQPPHFFLARHQGDERHATPASIRNGGSAAGRRAPDAGLLVHRAGVVDADQLVVSGCLPRQRLEEHIVAPGSASGQIVTSGQVSTPGCPR